MKGLTLKDGILHLPRFYLCTRESRESRVEFLDDCRRRKFIVVKVFRLLGDARNVSRLANGGFGTIGGGILCRAHYGKDDGRRGPSPRNPSKERLSCPLGRVPVSLRDTHREDVSGRTDYVQFTPQVSLVERLRETSQCPFIETHGTHDRPLVLEIVFPLAPNLLCFP